MHYLTRTLASIFTLSPILCAEEPVARLTVFSTVDAAKALHPRIYKTKTHSEAEDPGTAAETKKKICHYVTDSDLFRSFTHPTDLKFEQVYMYEIYDELRTSDQYANLFNEIYQKSPDGPLPPHNRDMIYVNPIRLVHVIDPATGENLPANVFICLVRSRKENFAESTFAKYYVSEEYNVRDEATLLSRPPIAGRFIYQHHDDDKITVLGLAEEPATVVTTSVRETVNRYLERKKGLKSAEEGSEAWLCKLKKDERLRLCNVVMNAAHYDGISRFAGFPRSEDAEKCKKLPVTLTLDRATPENDEKLVHEEWMVRCSSHRYVPAGIADVFTLSQAYGSTTDEVFVYRRKQKDDDNKYEYILENLTINVRYDAPIDGGKSSPAEGSESSSS